MAYKILYSALRDGKGADVTNERFPTIRAAEEAVRKRTRAYYTHRDCYTVVPVEDDLNAEAEKVIKEIEAADPNSPAASPAAYYGSLSPEPINVIDGWGLNYNRGNILKYLARAGRKNTEAASELKDLKKARSYLQREINRLEGKPGWES